MLLGKTNLELTQTKCNTIFRYLRLGFALWIAVVVLVIFPFTEDPTNPVKWLLLNWGAAALCAFLFILDWFNPPKPAVKSLSLKLFACLVGCLVLASFFSPHPLKSAVETGRFVVLLMLAFTTSRLISCTQHMQTVIASLCIPLGLSCLYGFLQGIGADWIQWNYQVSNKTDHLIGTLGHANYIGHAVVLGTVASAYLFLSGKKWNGGILIGIFLSHILLVRYRGGMAALGGASVCVLVILIVSKATSGKPVNRAFAAFIGSGLALVSAGLLAALFFFVRTGTPYPQDDSVICRLNGYRSALAMIQVRPVTGYGTGVYEIENPRFWTPYEKSRFASFLEMNRHVHNDTLEFAIDGGLPAAAIFVILVGYVIYAALRKGFESTTRSERRLAFFFALFFLVFFIDGCFGFPIRLPVSGAFFAAVLGAFHSLIESSPEDNPPTRASWLLYRSSVVWHWIGLVLLLLSCYFETMRFYGETLLCLADRANKANQPQTALALLHRAEATVPWGHLIPSEKGKTYVRLGQQEQALLAFRRALNRNPNHLPTLLNFARTALYVYQKQVEVNPENRDSALPLVQEARAAAGHAEALCPNMPEVHEIIEWFGANRSP